MTDTAAASPPMDLHKTLGQVRVLEMADGRAVIEYEAGMHMCHSGGVVQGGFVCGWIDAAMAHASMSQTGPDMTPMSLELKVSFFAPARPGKVVAEGWIERSGKSTSFAEGRLLGPNGEVLAKATTTIRLMPRARVEAAARAVAE
ncbi:PaaI family thioesterase [Phenylobacterium sp.]|uniref:PaaI family thioesterase n=1 Tax=Phenylobacterium sp. TaxID=1871053 RepID=UPI0035B2EC00